MVIILKKQANLRCVMIVQQLDPAYWLDWNEELISNAENDLKSVLEEVIERFDKGGCTVSECYGIVHNKDETTIWDQAQMKNITVVKPIHVHILCKFERGSTLNNLAVMVGVEPNFLERAKSGRYGWDNCLSYAVHAKNPEKHQYSPEEVITALGEDYLSVYNRRMEAWVRGRATKEAKETNHSVDYLISEVLKGNLRKQELLLTDEYYKVYALHKRKFNEAFETAGENKAYQTIDDLENGKFKKSIIYLMGKSGNGKTILSKRFIKIIQKIAKEKCTKQWDYCLTASMNAFDEYNGQDILFLDDIRGDSLSVSDWLKLLDPYTISPISARYHNKMGAAKLIILTSVKSPSEFFATAKGNKGEDLGQFFRRIDCLVKIDENFVFSSPIPNSGFNVSTTQLPFLPNPPSYVFTETGQYNEKDAIEKMIETVSKNMKWSEETLPPPRATKEANPNKK